MASAGVHRQACGIVPAQVHVQLPVGKPIGAQTDVAEFGALAARGNRAAEAGEPDLASAAFGDALALWRGAAFADVSCAPIRIAAESLAERRLLVAEAKAEADLALGRHGTVADQLSGWLISHPFRERLRGLTMLALTAWDAVPRRSASTTPASR
jgi:DNA-binding SARP family transcriptional activator